MTAKEKAKDLLHKFYFSLPNNGGFTGLCNINQRWEEGKICALIALRETIWGYLDQYPIEIQNYWQEVKQEIEKL